MEKGKLILIGALCLIMLALVVVPASAMVYYSGGEKIGTNNIVPITNDPPSTGTLNIYTMCLQGAYSNTIIMTPLVPTPGMTEPLITNGLVNPALIQTFFEQVPPSTTLTLGADGQYSGNVAPGIYELELTDGNAGQPEYALVQIVAGGDVTVRFIGHAASGGAVTTPPATIPEEIDFTIPSGYTFLFTSAGYVGVWNPSANPPAFTTTGSSENVLLPLNIQTVIDLLKINTDRTLDIKASVGQIFVNGKDIMAPHDTDPASGLVKELKLSYTFTYQDGTKQETVGHHTITVPNYVTKTGTAYLYEDDAVNPYAVPNAVVGPLAITL